jgi:hypothetical protein
MVDAVTAEGMLQHGRTHDQVAGHQVVDQDVAPPDRAPGAGDPAGPPRHQVKQVPAPESDTAGVFRAHIGIQIQVCHREADQAVQDRQAAVVWEVLTPVM